MGLFNKFKQSLNKENKQNIQKDISVVSYAHRKNNNFFWLPLIFAFNDFMF